MYENTDREKKEIPNVEVWSYTPNHQVVYPLKSVYHALSIYRDGSPVGQLSSRSPEKDRIQISRNIETIRLSSIYHTFDVYFDASEKEHIYNQIVLALKAVLEDLTYEQKSAFKARFIGFKYGSDTGDVKTLTCAEIAKAVGRSTRTVERWVHDVLDELRDELVRRLLLAPPNR